MLLLLPFSVIVTTTNIAITTIIPTTIIIPNCMCKGLRPYFALNANRHNHDHQNSYRVCVEISLR